MPRFLVVSYDSDQHQTFHDVVDVDLAHAGDRLDEEGRHEVAIALAERRVGRIRDYADHVATYSLDELRLQVDQIEAHSRRDVENGLATMEGPRAWHLHNEIDAILAERDAEQEAHPGHGAPGFRQPGRPCEGTGVNADLRLRRPGFDMLALAPTASALDR